MFESVCVFQGRQIELHYDGFSEELNQWVDDDCPDIHPCGWAAKTGHPLQGPLTPQVRSTSFSIITVLRIRIRDPVPF
jgi:hypothetical protein